MTDAEELRRLLGEGTKGEWSHLGRYVACDGVIVADCRRYSEQPMQEANAALITAAINALPGLLDRVEELEKAVADAMQRLNESGTGEMGLIDTIHATHGILARALSPSMKVERKQ